MIYVIYRPTFKFLFVLYAPLSESKAFITSLDRGSVRLESRHRMEARLLVVCQKVSRSFARQRTCVWHPD